MSSIFKVPVVKVKLHPHPNADTLSLVRVGGWQVVVKTAEWKDDELGAYIQPDSVVPFTSEWGWLGSEPRHHRITVRRFRKEWSQGLLVKAPAGAKEGNDVSSLLGITAWEPPSSEGSSSRQQRRKSWWRRLYEGFLELGVRPRGRYPYYDVEHLRNFPNALDGEQVIITEKIHGANGLFMYKRNWLGLGKFYLRSRTQWKKFGDGSWWSEALRHNLDLQRILKCNPGVAFYGEVFGEGVQNLTYGKRIPEVLLFEAYDQKEGWLQYTDSCFVPEIYCGTFPGIEALNQWAEEDSIVGPKGHVREGLVIRHCAGRPQFKIVSNRYLEEESK